MKLPDIPERKDLLLKKHADYIAAYEKDKNDYVSASYKPMQLDGFSLKFLKK